MGNLVIKLLNMSISASWLIVMVILLRMAMRKTPKWVICLLWGLVAIKLVCPINIPSVFSVYRLAPFEISYISNNNEQLTPSETITDTHQINHSNAVIGDNNISGAADVTGQNETNYGSYYLIAVIVWGAGVLAVFMYGLYSYVGLRIKLREAIRYKGNIRISDNVRTPFILGLLKPVIYISSEIDEDRLEYVIAHEQAHLKRLDNWWKVFAYGLLCVYWFNPMCWIAYILFCRDIELACDEKVIKNADYAWKKEYSKVLLSYSVPRKIIKVCSLEFGEIGVKERINMVLNYKKPVFWSVLAALGICVVTAVCFLTGPVNGAAGSNVNLPIGEKSQETNADALDKAISDSIMANNSDKYLSGDYACESHKVLYKINMDEQSSLTVIVQKQYTEYDLDGETLTEVSGGSGPAALSFLINENGEYVPVAYEDIIIPEDYISSHSIKESQEVLNALNSVSEKDVTELRQACKDKALNMALH